MRQERHMDHPRNNHLEDFRALLKSDYWECLPQKTREEILIILAEYRGEYAKEKR